MGFMKILTYLVNSTLSGTELSSSELNASEQDQKLVNDLLISNERGENGLYRALTAQNSAVSGNIKIHLDALAQAGFFTAPSATINKKSLICAIFKIGEYSSSVLGEAMWNPDALQQILIALEKADCFNTEHNQQAFIDALVSTNFIGKSPLHIAAHDYKSLKQVNDYLKKTNCYTHPENKQKLIDAIFLPNLNGENALFNACHNNNGECISLLLDMLTHAGCFEGLPGSKNQQAFVNAVFAANENQMSSLFYLYNKSQILHQLMKIKYLEGPFAELNKQNLAKVLFTEAKIGKYHQGNAFAANSRWQLFPVVMEHLAAADCFSAESPYSKQFIQAVFAKTRYAHNLLSDMYHPEKIILLLNKLTEAGCFNDEATKKQFRDAVRADGNAILSRVIRGDCRVYLRLHQCLRAAGFTAQDIKQLLNEPVVLKFDYWELATPLMIALLRKHNLLAARLIADGAELTESQKQQVECALKDQQQAEAAVAPLDRATIKRELIQTEKNAPYKKPKLEKTASLSDLSLFAEKKSANPIQHVTRDDGFIKRITPR
ncbi:hypothetical protein [Legionella sainthelensi]|uniref:Uncharacterized protein n=1 Tax=Legionella sainthelensi TaxID=28087 RepID=A0A2H5FGE9_9GAMM|nr:hypothetical protein [Legionella sainthelensi]AUH70635.1 hypothetical protein CAB17_00150 [Legionella sainthelensi]